ncbi:MAG: hypothetical protein M3303_11290 [Gemmatimonadota bacterium]|nr:hypothetical protein [Gemmatimonadota bacterium]
MRELSILLMTVLAATGCAQRPLFLQPRPVREWPPALQAAKQAAREGRFVQADSVLAQFAARNAGSYEAREATYWRALFQVDPANTQASPADALRSLNQYFVDGSTVDGYDEATVLRRVVQHTDSLERSLEQARRLIAEAQEAAAEPRPAAAAPAAPERRETRGERDERANRNLVEQVRRLRDELAKSNQELERVRRRLSEQRP